MATIASSLRRFAILALLALVAGCGSDEPNGLYLMTRYAGWLELGAWYFHDGEVSRRPMGDIEDFDFDHAAEAAPGDTGEFEVDDDQLIVTWTDGGKREGRYEPKDKGCFYWDGGLFCPVKEFDDDEIEGTFAGGASAGGGAVQSAVTLSFTEDGDYEMRGVGSVSTGGERAGAYAGSSGGEKGTYELSGTRLTLEPEEGPEREVLVIPYDDGSKGDQPRQIYFDGAMLKRQ